MLYKIEKKNKSITDGNFEEYIKIFYKKAMNVIITINDMLSNNYITSDEIETFMNKIYKIDEREQIETLNNIGLLNKIKNFDIENEIPLTNTNELYYNVNKIDQNLNNKNNTNTTFNVAVNDVSPGTLNSIKRITQLLNLNINSCFRHNYFKNSPTDFLYNFPIEIKNVLSMRLVSIELPNSWYLFSSIKKNNVFYIILNEFVKN